MVRVGYTTTFVVYSKLKYFCLPFELSPKKALWQTVKAAMNCPKHDMTFHQGLRTF